MGASLASRLSAVPGWPYLLIAVGVAGCGLMAARVFRKRPSAAELERCRRLTIQNAGKLGDANLLEVHGRVLVYSYEVRGVAYTASQDISALAALGPEDLAAAIGPVYVKYDPKNPADSIVLAEEWSGLWRNHR